MKEKLEFLLHAKSLTPTTLARLLEIQPSGVSHILSGRNKPSFDLVVKILKAFPDINPDWLLLDDERVYRDEVPSSTFAPTTSADLQLSDQASLFSDSANSRSSEGNSELKNDIASIFSSPSSVGKSVERIIILYSDKTFDSYNR